MNYVRERQIPHHFTYTCTWNLKNKLNEQTKQKQMHGHREHFDGCQTGGVYMGEIGEGLRFASRQVQKHSMVNNVIITTCQVGHRLTGGIISQVYTCLMATLHT